jgi:hypothetical protein
MKNILLSLLLAAFASSSASIKIDKSMIMAASSVGAFKLYHNGTNFIAKQNGVRTEIGSESLDSALRRVNSHNLSAFLKCGRIMVTRSTDGSLILRHHVNGIGGGPVAASIGYWGTKVLCWAGIITAGGAAVASGVGAGVALAGGGAAAATAGGLVVGTAKVGMGIAVKGAMTSIVTGVASTAATGGASIVATGLGATAAGTAASSLGTAALISGTAGTSLGVVGSIEAMALAAFAAGMALPTP